MLSLGFLGFAQPWLLGALLALPGLWLLLRVTPPAPRRIAFPPVDLLRRLLVKEETPARTPWWLLALRMAIACLLILAFARPIIDPAPALDGRGPVVIVLDDGWAAAAEWRERQEALTGVLEQADRELRSVILVHTARAAASAPLVERAPARVLLASIQSLEPQPWPVDRAAVIDLIGELGPELEGATPSIVWLSDGVASGPEGDTEARQLALALRQLGPLDIRAPTPNELPLLLEQPIQTPEGLNLRVLRAAAGPPRALSLIALNEENEILARVPMQFGDDSGEADAELNLPIDLRNRIARVEIETTTGQTSTLGGTVLFDERWRRHSVGLVGDPNEARAQPLLAELYFIERALAPYAEIRMATIDALLETPLSMIVMPDTGTLDAADRVRLQEWIEAGGVVLRFAGPKLAAGSGELLPVPLRAGDRRLGGALSWSEPLGLAAFPENGPYADLVPTDDILVYRQVLAQPDPNLTEATMARLSDGTPLITGKQEGSGWLILVHTTANTGWTSLPLSGIFVDILRDTLHLAQGAGSLPSGRLELDLMLDASGRLVAPSRLVTPVEAENFSDLEPGPNTPPGLWAPVAGPDETETELPRLALNLQSEVRDIIPIERSGYGTDVEDYGVAREFELTPWLLAVALALVTLDLMIALVMRGLLPELRRAAGPAAVIVLLQAFASFDASAQDINSQDQMLGATDATHLAYVITGNNETDALSEAGLTGLTRTILRRTSIEADEPVGVNITSDELAAFPLIYWPIPADHPDVDESVLDRVETYLSHGGMILFDTGDAGELLPGQLGAGGGEQRLAEILGTLDIPPLIPVPQDHVLTRSFYLLQEFPGRWTGGAVWVDDAPEGINDGVASVIIGSHDWAGAWAEDEYGRSLLPVMPGGEEQREWARRFGVNLVMYALTGNYKTDQVHVPALLERLGQ